jgi:hypothetical protein
MHNMYEAYRHMYEALGIKNIDMILNRPAQPQPLILLWNIFNL